MQERRSPSKRRSRPRRMFTDPSLGFMEKRKGTKRRIKERRNICLYIISAAQYDAECAKLKESILGLFKRMNPGKDLRIISIAPEEVPVLTDGKKDLFTKELFVFFGPKNPGNPFPEFRNMLYADPSSEANKISLLKIISSLKY